MPFFLGHFALEIYWIENKIKSWGESLQAPDGHELNPHSKAKNERSKCSSERSKYSDERSKCASITLPAFSEQQVVEQRHLSYQDQHQVFDGTLKPDYDELEQKAIDFGMYQRLEEHNDTNFQEESYHEYVNNFQQEQFQMEETANYDTRYMSTTIEKPQLQMKRLYNEFENNWDFFPTPHLVISIEEKWSSCKLLVFHF